MVCLCSDLFQRRGHAQAALVVPELQTAKERPFLLAQRPWQPDEEGSGQEALCITGTTEHKDTHTDRDWVFSYYNTGTFKGAMCNFHKSLLMTVLNGIKCCNLQQFSLV